MHIYAQNVEMRIVYVQGQKRPHWTVDNFWSITLHVWPLCN